MFSCSKSSTITNELGNTYCNGEQSCAESPIEMSRTGYKLLCRGDHSCFESDIVSTVADIGIFMHGDLSGLNAKISIEGTSVSSYWYFYGSSSGYNASIECSSSQTCNIYCHGNACNEINLINNGGNVICHTSLSAEKSDVCPDGYDVPDFIDSIPILVNTTVSTYENSVLVCNNSVTGSWVKYINV